MKTFQWTAFLSICLLLLVAQTPAQQILINEVDSDTPGVDTMEFVELYDGGIGNFPLNGLVLVFFNGSTTGDLSYRAVDLTGFLTDANGYFVVGNAGVTPTPGIVIPNNGIQNGADAIGLYADPISAWPNGTPASSVNLVDAVVYGTNDAPDTALLALLTPGQSQINESGGGSSSSDSIGRCPDGGLPLVTASYTTMAPTPGAPNVCAAAYPGTGEDLILRTGVNTFPTGGPGNDIKTALAGDVLQVEIESPAATFTGSPYLVLVELFATGFPPPSPLPGVNVSLTGFVILMDGATPVGPGLQPQLPPFGITNSFLVPAGLSSTSLMIQGFALSPLATNGVFAAADAHEIQLL